MTLTATGPVATEMLTRLGAALAPTILSLIDESASHQGHAGHDGRGESGRSAGTWGDGAGDAVTRKTYLPQRRQEHKENHNHMFLVFFVLLASLREIGFGPTAVARR